MDRVKQGVNMKELIKDQLNVDDFVYISPNAYGDKDKTSRAKIIGIGKNILEIQYVVTGEYNAIPYVNIRNLKFEGGFKMWKDYGWVIAQEEKITKEKRKERVKAMLHKPTNNPADKLVYDGNTLSNAFKGISISRHESEPEDLEKAVMMYLLKDMGYTYSDVHKVLESVEIKWIPKDGEDFFYITSEGDIIPQNYDSKSIQHINICNFGNYFKTEEDAINARSKILNIFKESKDNA